MLTLVSVATRRPRPVASHRAAREHSTKTESCPAPRTPQDHEVDAKREGGFSRIVPLKLAFPVPELLLTVDEERDTESGRMLKAAKAETSDATHGQDATI